MVVHILGALTLAFLGVVAYRLLRHPERGLANLLTVHELGALEGQIPGLLRVIVVCDHIEDPFAELRLSVEHNLRSSVKYLFLVSKTRAGKEVQGYYKIFQAFEAIVLAESSELSQLVDIHSLPYDWPDHPYIFYETVAEGGDRRFLALRGNQRGEGIADFYTVLSPKQGHMIAQALLSEAPQPIRVTRKQFEGPPLVGLPPSAPLAKSLTVN